MTRLILTLLLAAVGCNRSSGSELATSQSAAKSGAVVRIGYQKSGAPFLLKSRSESLAARLQEQGATLEWLEFQAGPLLLEAMRAGSVDVGYVGETPPVFAQAGNVPFLYVAHEAPAPQAEAIIVPQRSPLQRLSDLRGKRVALNRGSNVHFLLLQALAKAGLTLDDLQVTFLPPADARAAFDSGNVDAWVIWDPFFAAAELAGARVLQDGEGLVDNHQYYVARKEFAAAQPKLLQIVLGAFDELGKWAGEHPEETAKLNASASGISYDALLRAEKRHTYGLLPITPDILQRQQRIADAFVKVNAIPREIETKQAFVANNNWSAH